ncbi:hypothetical protein N7452_005460 [Penicillium brevicompactum]|uniref:Uncharacterized protein n=1 Tax=Penicillium brevicompactum TaxID=5074 RepID=A0A9W9QIN1_PENBR|nr:hypothetical protein N7452_005460 [Penicillium brevicompactum]
MSSNSGRTGRANYRSEKSQCDNSRKIIEAEKYWLKPSQISDPLAGNTGIVRRNVIYLPEKVVWAVNAPNVMIDSWAFDPSFSQLFIVSINRHLPYWASVGILLGILNFIKGSGCFFKPEDT